MLNFAQSQYLLLLLLIPVFFIVQALVLKMRRNRIRKFGDEAHYAIFVSVAWFTNKKLFNALLDKARHNCYVSMAR